MDHFDGITPDQRYKNDVLTELRLIRQLLERNAQAVETSGDGIQPITRRGRQKRSV